MALNYSDYYADYRWCPSCRAYVHFLRALEKGYCVQCGGRIRCFRNPRAFEEAALPPDDEMFPGYPTGAPPVGGPDPGVPRSA